MTPPRRSARVSSKAHSEQPRAKDVTINSTGASPAPDVGGQVASPKAAGSGKAVKDKPKGACSGRPAHGTRTAARYERYECEEPREGGVGSQAAPCQLDRVDYVFASCATSTCPSASPNDEILGTPVSKAVPYSRGPLPLTRSGSTSSLSPEARGMCRWSYAR